jgi:hypothetical protein
LVSCRPHCTSNRLRWILQPQSLPSDSGGPRRGQPRLRRVVKDQEVRQQVPHSTLGCASRRAAPFSFPTLPAPFLPSQQRLTPRTTLPTVTLCALLKPARDLLWLQTVKSMPIARTPALAPAGRNRPRAKRTQFQPPGQTELSTKGQFRLSLMCLRLTPPHTHW